MNGHIAKPIDVPKLLEALGYNVRPVICRAVRGREGRMPINHRGLIVTLDEGRYSADVGFGGPMPAGALGLFPGVEQDICGETYIAERSDHAWWKIDRITKAERDLHDDGLPARRQTELELCTAAVEEIEDIRDIRALAHPYTRRLLEAGEMETESGEAGQKDEGILTEEKREYLAASFREGCVYAGHCPRAERKCFLERPGLVEREAGHRIACHFG